MKHIMKIDVAVLSNGWHRPFVLSKEKNNLDAYKLTLQEVLNLTTPNLEVLKTKRLRLGEHYEGYILILQKDGFIVGKMSGSFEHINPDNYLIWYEKDGYNWPREPGKSRNVLLLSQQLLDEEESAFREGRLFELNDGGSFLLKLKPLSNLPIAAKVKEAQEKKDFSGPKKPEEYDTEIKNKLRDAIYYGFSCLFHDDEAEILHKYFPNLWATISR